MTRPTRVLDDSEDDEEDLVSWHRDFETPAHDVNSNRNSTNSTEVLKAQIRHAHLDMASTAVETVTTVPGSRSTLKRSRTDMVPEIPSTDNNGRLKRARSYKDSPYGSSGLLLGESHVTSFSDHSQSAESRFAPTGPIAEGFLAHDPFVLFGQTGDTVPDNTATQTMKQAIAARKDDAQAIVMDATFDPDDRLHLRSSSVLFSGSQLFGSTEPPVELTTNVAITVIEADTSARLETPSQASTSSCIQVTATKTSASAKTSALTKASTHTTKAKEKTTALTEPASDKLSSSQVALIGLPKEQYKPRPSKRRATQLPDIPPEHLNDPNKISRSRRSKTASAVGKSSKTRRGSVQDNTIDEATMQAHADEASIGAEAELDAEDTVTVEDTITVSNLPAAQSTAPANDIDELAPSQPEHKDSTPPEVVFARPARLQRNKKTTTKATKRSHTTIFEDHLDLPTKSQRPSLSQQQADRMAVLTEIDKNVGKGKRGRRKLIEDDDEDELASPGVPAKTSIAKRSNLQEEPATAPEPAQQNDVADVAAQHTATALPEVVDMPSSPPATSASHALTPGPPSITIQPTTTISAPTSDPPPSSPTHSPIKAGTIAHRVGLSRRHRIPSLLKIVRPMKQA